MIEESRAYRYAKWCVARGNRKVGKYVKLQAKKWLKIADGKHKQAYVSEKAYKTVSYTHLRQLAQHISTQPPADLRRSRSPECR